MSRTALATLLLATLPTFGADDDPLVAEMAKIEGTWVVVKSYGADGEEKPLERYEQTNYRMTIGGGTLTNSTSNGSRSFPLKLDPSRSPKQLDMVIKSGAPVRQGIYHVDGDRLEIAWVAGFMDPRPKQLTPCPKDSGARWDYAIYRREKTL